MIDEIAEAEPFAPFRRWLDEAWQGEPNAHAMILATTTSEGRPSARAVLLKGLDDRGFVFYTNLESRKSKELLANPHAALCFMWKSLNRQVRVEGPVELVSDEEADAYFASRPRDSQIGAWASDQSQPLASRAELERRVEEFSRRFPEGAVPRPPHWSGFRVVPQPIEFWQERPFRLHDRLLFVREGDGMATGTAIPLIHGPASERLRRIATYASVAVAAVLIAVKFAAWLETGSVALLSSLVDSLLDIVASLVNLVAVRHAMSPADREHRFGHGKAEPLAVLGQSAFITGSAMLLLAEAVRRLIWPVRGREPAGRHRRHGVLDRCDDRAGFLSASCRAAHRVDRDQRRRAALPQRRRLESERHRGACPGQRLQFSAARPAVRRGDRYLDRLLRGAAGAPVAVPADGPRAARRGAREDPRDCAVASRCGRRA